MEDVIEGILRLYVRQSDQVLQKEADKNVRMRIIKNSKSMFKNKFMSNCYVDFKYWKEEMSSNLGGGFLSLADPYSAATCTILTFYSMEFCDPQVFSEANRVARDNDLNLLAELGPFLKALFWITYSAEKYRDTLNLLEQLVLPGKLICLFILS